MCEYKGVKPTCEMKVKEVGSCKKVHNPPAPILRKKGLSVSTSVGTRKMVNYA